MSTMLRLRIFFLLLSVCSWTVQSQSADCPCLTATTPEPRTAGPLALAETAFNLIACKPTPISSAQVLAALDKCEEIVEGREGVGLKLLCMKTMGNEGNRVKLHAKFCSDDGFKMSVLACQENKFKTAPYRSRRNFAPIGATRDGWLAIDCRRKVLTF